jgi:hypothetical protein
MRKITPPITPLAYTPARAAASLDVGPDYFDEHVAPHLRVIRRGKKRIYPVAELARWLDEHAEAPMAEQIDGAR